MSKTIEVFTCRNCGYDNPAWNKKCNNCFTSFEKGSIFGAVWDDSKYYLRWVCKNCGRLNLDSNKKCSGCFNKR